MKYNININQAVLADTNLDFVEAAILDYVYFICSSVNQKIEKQRITDDLGIWTWVDYASLIEDMPLLRIKDKAALTRRMHKLQKEGFIQVKHGKGYKLYILLTEKVDSLYIKPALTFINATDERQTSVDEKQRLQPQPALTNINASVDEIGTDNNISNKNTKDNKTTTDVVAQNANAEVSDKRNKDIQEGINLLRELFGHISKERMNRFALQRLFVSKGKDRVIKAIRFAHKCRDMQFCPVISNYKDLEDKWIPLETFARREMQVTRGGGKHFDAEAELRKRRLDSQNREEGVLIT